MVVSNAGTVYGFGNNNSGRCGLDKYTCTPTLIDLPSVIIQRVECGKYHSLLLSSKGMALSCGNGEYNGHGDKKNNIYKPQAIPSLESEIITDLAVGDCHSICVAS